MSKKKWIIIAASILLVVAIGVGLGVGLGIGLKSSEDPRSYYADDSVYVHIGSEYKDKFLAREFTVEDFSWDNVERLKYYFGFNDSHPDYGLICVYLKEHGMKQVEEAIEHFSSLEFVESAIKVGIFYFD
ncbi:MAG: hypothetical protein J1F36_04365 [Clostridiales bacterium]|nr:hypothetical protein [Clostridiales bacterium]